MATVVAASFPPYIDEIQEICRSGGLSETLNINIENEFDNLVLDMDEERLFSMDNDEDILLIEENDEFKHSLLNGDISVSTDVVEVPVSAPIKFPDYRPPVKIGPSDFELLKVIGMGAFGKVLQVRSRRNGQICAMKCISKKMLHQKSHLSYLKTERDIMARVDHPFIVGLKCAFQTEKKLFLVMEYLPGGELFFHLHKKGLLLEKNAVFYAAEMVLALEHLHSTGIVHRDLKPENLLLNAEGHVCLTDFGLAKELEQEEEDGLKTICGTNEYMAPEMILRRGYGKAVDWWSMGALMFEMMSGDPPFRGKNSKEINTRILNDKVSLPKWVSPPGHQIVKALLEKDVSRRLGAARGTMFEVGGVTAIKQHKFFAGIDWAALFAKQVPPPFVPHIPEGPADTSNFCEEFIVMPLPRSFSEDSNISRHTAPIEPLLCTLPYDSPAIIEGDTGELLPLPRTKKQEANSKYVLPNGMFKGFSFVADRFDFGTGTWIPLKEEEESERSDTGGYKQLSNGFHIGPLVVLDGTPEARKRMEASKKAKGKRNRKKNLKPTKNIENDVDLAKVDKKDSSVIVPNLVLAAVASAKLLPTHNEVIIEKSKIAIHSAPIKSTLAMLLKEQDSQKEEVKLNISSQNITNLPTKSSSESVWQVVKVPRPARVPQPELVPPSPMARAVRGGHISAQEPYVSPSWGGHDVTQPPTAMKASAPDSWAARLGARSGSSPVPVEIGVKAEQNNITQHEDFPALSWSTASRRGTKAPATQSTNTNSAWRR